MMRTERCGARPRAGLWVALLLLASAAVTAQRHDPEQPISVSSDRASYTAGRGVYEGNVVMEQGALRIEADTLVVHEQDRAIQRLVAHGEPASFEQREGEDRDPVQAYAETIEYQIESRQVILLGDAIVHQQDSEIRGQRIVYHSVEQTLQAEGDSERGPGRVDMILQPRDRER